MTVLAETVTAPSAPASPSAWHYFRSVVSTAVSVLLVVVASIALVLAVATHFSPRGQYRVFGHPVMIVLSGSMTPAIDTGDLVVDDLVTPTQAKRLHVGQIISVRDAPGSATIITHRIVGVIRHGASVSYITKGDANNSADATPRPASDVVGLFSFDVRRGGYLLNALHEPLTLGLLLSSPILWFMAGLLWQWARELDGATPTASTVGQGDEPGEDA